MISHKDVSMALSRAPFGLAAPEVRVEVHLGPGLPTFINVVPLLLSPGILPDEGDGDANT